MENFYTEEEKYWLTGGNTGTLPDRIATMTPIVFSASRRLIDSFCSITILFYQ